jgi:mannose-6-phosphate isomerase-like protein (cupin superfamily)
MTYPKALYSADDGEVSARIRRADSEPDLVRSSGTRVHYLATGASTGGLFGLYRWSMGPGKGGADPHFHRTMAESFYILTGTVRIFDGTAWSDAQAGDFMHVPPGGIHAFSNESGAGSTSKASTGWKTCRASSGPPSSSHTTTCTSSEEIETRPQDSSSSGVSARRTQNSLPSGSAITTQVTSGPCPTETRFAPSPSRRATSAA